MMAEGKNLPKLVLVKMASCFDYSNLCKRFIPVMRRGNQPDMPTTTNDRLWFLSENRFLFFTRGGPVEVTLKPSFVLAGILVCMAGVAAIFYSTLIASYSAIEVMRDETIQSAQASSSATVGNDPRVNIAKSLAMTWHSYQSIEPQIKQPQSAINDHSSSFSETARNSIGISQQKPGKNAIAVNRAVDEMPMIINRGKRVTLASEINTKESGITSPGSSSTKTPRANFASTNRNTYPLATKNSKKKNVSDNVRKHISTSHAVQKSDATSEEKTLNLAMKAHEFAVSLMPTFKATSSLSKTPKQKTENFSTLPFTTASLAPTLPSKFLIQPKNEAQTKQNPPNTGAKKALPKIGLSPDALIKKNGPVLPIVTKAARTKKMLLSFQQEINYIRATMSKLGIPLEALPESNVVNSQAGDGKFQSMMINLADHRAALRRIPFKPPMLYFYISSDYGKRKHPKTGKITFHHGVDLAGTWQENVRVTAPGTVIFAGREGSFGKVVRVQHGFGVTTTYAHLARITVTIGEYVSENHIVGKMGNTGKSAGAHLHYEIRVNNKSINPNYFMKIGRQISVAGALRKSALAE